METENRRRHNIVVPDNDHQSVAGLIAEGDEDQCPSTRKQYKHR